MIKRFLGIRELESNLKKLKNFFNNHWTHTNYLHKKTEQHALKLNEHSSKINEHSLKLEKIEKELENRTKTIILLMENMLERLEAMQIEQAEIENTPEPVEHSIVIRKKEFADKDRIILQILHQNAAFDSKNSMETSDIYANLPFSITARGLRKKLATLEAIGLLSSKKQGKKNKWYVRTGKLANVSEIISEPKRKKRNRN